LPQIDGLRVEALYVRIRSEEYLDDLEAVESQRRRIKEIVQRTKDASLEIPVETPGRRERIRGYVTKSFHEIFDEVLLPPQQTRFVQLMHQTQLANHGGSVVSYFAQKDVGPLIGISAKQKKSLEKIHQRKLEELQKTSEEFRVKIATIIAEERRLALDELDDDQRKKAVNLIGDRFYVQPIGNEARFYLDRAIRKSQLPKQ
jgi:hypothetical protein